MCVSHGAVTLVSPQGILQIPGKSPLEMSPGEVTRLSPGFWPLPLAQLGFVFGSWPNLLVLPRAPSLTPCGEICGAGWGFVWMDGLRSQMRDLWEHLRYFRWVFEGFARIFEIFGWTFEGFVRILEIFGWIDEVLSQSSAWTNQTQLPQAWEVLQTPNQSAPGAPGLSGPEEPRPGHSTPDVPHLGRAEGRDHPRTCWRCRCPPGFHFPQEPQEPRLGRNSPSGAHSSHLRVHPVVSHTPEFTPELTHLPRAAPKHPRLRFPPGTAHNLPTSNMAAAASPAPENGGKRGRAEAGSGRKWIRPELGPPQADAQGLAARRDGGWRPR